MALSPVNAGLPITQKGDLPDPRFVQQLQNAFDALDAQVAQVTALAQQTQQALQQAQLAQQTANQPPPSGPTTSGSASLGSLLITNAWTPGPQVDLTGVSASDLKNCSVTLAFGANPAIVNGEVVGSGYGQVILADGEARIVEIDGVTETTVYPPTGTAGFGAQAAYGGYTLNYTIAPDFLSALASFSTPRTSTGAISYRLDLRTTNPGSAQLANVVAYLFVDRTV